MYYKELLNEKNDVKFVHELNSSAVNTYEYILDKFTNGDSIDTDEFKNFLLCLDRIYSMTDTISPIRDEEYDALHNIYEELTGGDVIRGDLYAPKKVTHMYPELKGTIKKCHYVTEEERINDDSAIATHMSLEKFIRDSYKLFDKTKLHRIQLSPKYDGVSMIFGLDKDGKIISAITRGDVVYGTGSNMIEMLQGVNIEIPNGLDGPIGIKTECIMARDEFKEYNKKYGNNKLIDERSAVNSIIGSDYATPQQLSFLTFKELSYIKSDMKYPKPIDTHNDYDNGILDLRFAIGNDDSLEEFIRNLPNIIKTLSDTYNDPDLVYYNCDGIVVRWVDNYDMDILGRDEDRCINNYERAWKFPPAKTKSKIIDIVQDIGYLGIVSFTAKIEPVVMKNKTIKSISLGSKDRFEFLNLAKGDEVIVKYDIIPYLDIDDTCTKSGNEPIKLIAKCPYCGERLEYNPEYMCVNPDCSCRMIGKIYNYCDKMNIENIGESTITALFNAGILKSIEDLYRLDRYKDIIISLDGFGEKKYKNIINSLSKVLDVPYYILLGSIGIQSIGRRTFKKIMEDIDVIDIVENEEWDKLRESLINKEGFKEKKIDKIITGLKDNRNLILFLTNIIEDEDTKKIKGRCVFTGFRNNRFEAYLKKLGYEVQDNVTKDTDFVIAKSTNPNAKKSSKILKAEKYNIPIFSEASAYIHFKYN